MVRHDHHKYPNLNTAVERGRETGQMTPSWQLNRDTCQGWGVLTFVLELAENSSLDLDSIASPCSVLIQMSDFYSIWHHQTLTHIRIVTSWDFLANLTLLPPRANLCSLVLDSIASPSSDPDFRFSLHWAPLYQDIVTSWDFLANLTPLPPWANLCFLVLDPIASPSFDPDFHSGTIS